MSMTNYLENAVLNHFLRSTSTSSPANVYVALFTSSPGEGGGGTEVSGGAYSRVSATFSAPSSGVTSNSSTITFPSATASWGTVTHTAVFDAISGGNMLFYGELDASKAVGLGDVVQFQATDLSITLD